MDKGSRNLQEVQPNIRTESKAVFRVSSQWKVWTETVWSSKSSKHGHGAVLCYFSLSKTSSIHYRATVTQLRTEQKSKQNDNLYSLRWLTT